MPSRSNSCSSDLSSCFVLLSSLIALRISAEPTIRILATFSNETPAAPPKLRRAARGARRPYHQPAPLALYSLLPPSLPAYTRPSHPARSWSPAPDCPRTCASEPVSSAAAPHLERILP